MISRRNFFAMATVMLVVLFLFQFSNIAIEAWNDYEENKYVAHRDALPGRDAAFSPQTAAVEESDRPLVVYIGRESGPQGQIVASWAGYTKRAFAGFANLDQYEGAGLRIPQIIAVDGSGLDWDGDACARLRNYGEAGSNLIFCSLPEEGLVEENRELQALLGIREVRRDQGGVAGVHLYKDFLLGGEVVYRAKDQEEEEKRQDLDLDFPWYVLDAGTKAYMRGIPADEDMESEDLPAILWRNGLGTAHVFAVNGDYMRDTAGLGLLSAMAAEMTGCEVYPVVNAQNFVAANYPGLASENGQEMTRYYSQSMRGVFRDVVWPDLVAMYQQNRMGLTCLIAPQFDYGDLSLPDRVQFIRYMKLLNEQGAEAGLSLVSWSDTPVVEKLAEDFQFMKDAQLDYDFTSLYVGDMPEDRVNEALGWEDLDQVRTVVADFDHSGQVVGYQAQNVTRQTGLAQGLADTYSEDFRFRCVETALAYANVLLDMTQVAWPQSRLDAWDGVSAMAQEDLARQRTAYKYFTGTTASESDGRIRNFLSLDYSVEAEDQEVAIHRENVEGESWFILRLAGKAVRSVEGGSFVKLEDSAYLIEAREDDVTVKLRSQLSMEERNGPARAED